MHYYYFIWNLDANANLPLASSIQHAKFVGYHIGLWMLAALAVTAIVTILATACQEGFAGWRRINWRVLVFSAVPVGYLVISDAGLNQFVSIVGCAELIMFLLDPIAGARPRFALLLSLLVIGGLALTGMINAAHGIASHRGDGLGQSYISHRDGLNKIIDLMIERANRNGPRVHVFGTAHSGSLAGAVLTNLLLYDYGFRGVPRTPLARDGINLQYKGTAVATQVEWLRYRGQNDDERIATILSMWNEQTDFLIVPSEEADLPQSVLANRLLSSGQWLQVGDPIKVSPTERLLFLINSKRMDAP